MVVVSDKPDLLLLWMPHGTVRKVPATPPGRVAAPEPKDRAIANLQHDDWILEDHIWDVSTLWLVRPGDWHSTWASWRPDGSALGWYINFQQPFVRTEAGIEAMDLALDIVAEPDCSSWRWKDAEEFDEIVDRGIFEPSVANAVRSEAERVIALMERQAAPFDYPWHDWRPDPEWPRPELPERWNKP